MAKVASIGIPVKLLHEGLGHTITVETKTGSLYRGTLENAEDNMNMLIQGVSVTHKDGKVLSLEQVQMVIFPDMLRHAPMFKFADRSKGRRPLGLVGMRRAMNMRNARGRGGRGGRGRGGGF
ncbi:small nuclear ribonucleoprotein, putative [Eimeria acervulina]|uniref:Small nuclear ribonucleoprotein Sm D3 n=1 Tax=Eimeria acervulina TaxID=5801 RepID=U6H068_EIMAC|nr:small nuclear ribonucleoprotein, putative [Eimeria acervulina]CDI84144.1 small nuclear ribonucleoprotein, putative [Eimeria acervulina]